MVTALVDNDKLSSELKVKMYDFDPDSADPVDVGWVEMGRHFLAMFFRTVGTGNVDTFRILGNAQSDGSGTDVIVLAKTISSEPNAVGDQIFLEISEEQLKEVGAAAGENLKYVSLQIEFQTLTDEGVVTYVVDPQRKAEDLTADIVA